MIKDKVIWLKNQIQKSIKSKNYPLVYILIEKYKSNVGEIHEKKS